MTVHKTSYYTYSIVKHCHMDPVGDGTRRNFLSRTFGDAARARITNIFGTYTLNSQYIKTNLYC